MKKKHRLFKTLLVFSALALFTTGCTNLEYVSEDSTTVKPTRVQTRENFNFQVIEKSIDNINIKAGISETVLDNALVLYMSVQNNSSEKYRFSMDDIKVTSPIGEVSTIPAGYYIEGFYATEVTNYAGLSNAGAAIGNFANIQNSQYMQNYANAQTQLSNTTGNSSPEMASVEETIQGIQKHTITTFKMIQPNSKEYFYIFLRKPEEYPIVVNYKTLTYKFGGKKNNEQK